MTDLVHHQHVFPTWVTRFRYWDVVLMCVTASQILYSYVGRPTTLNKQYYSFLVDVSAKLFLITSI